MAEKPKKPQKLKARLPRGLEDRGPAAINATRAMVEKIRAVYELYGFEPVETPAMEYTDALGKFLPDQDRPNEGVFSFQDDDEQWISLRYDLTAPLARYVAENFDALPKPYRSYRFGYVFRNEKPGPGRFRQFMQFDADTVGSATPAADAEICMMAADTMEALGIPRGSYVVKVNNRKVFDGLLDAIGLGDDQASRRLTVLRAIDKADKFPLAEIRKLLGEGRKDESGDFTKGAQLSADQANTVVRAIAPFDYIRLREQRGDRIDRLLEFFDRSWRKPFSRSRYQQFLKSFFGLRSLPDLVTEGLHEIELIRRLVRAAGYGPDRIRIDPSVVRGLEYYTGPVYEVELLLPTKDERGRPVRFGSVGGGGRYDGLVSRFRGEPVPATGFSIGVSRLQAALALLGDQDARPDFGPVVVTVFDRERITDYQRMVARLRDANIRAELYLGNPKNMGNQLKYADRRNAPCVIIQGSDEKNDPAGPQVIIKNLILGAHLATIEKDRDEYLQKQALLQVKVAEDFLVEEVQKLLNWHDLR
ncbi:histidine--tRNA ligase [Bradyrhizobium sp. UFLA03-84]|uniref:histidine--tRNA ligase n=1 Tax=Bradyrhizobium sp. UFLA03-84 TaxID=418599 RepID=UPI000BAE03F0|nr:histidine--tRNA ligase [Bradyrhizobium sp. UFLA03-84]PAY07068.1 histidine--tRNA ligase [Bradyrhizobium sp. UFLA03-84]